MPLDFTKPVRLKGSKTPVRILCSDRAGKLPVIGLFKDGPANFERVGTWSLDGIFESSNFTDYYLEQSHLTVYCLFFKDPAGNILKQVEYYPTPEDANVVALARGAFGTDLRACVVPVDLPL